MDTIEQYQSIDETEKKSSDEFKQIFDYYAERFNSDTRDEVINSLSKLPSLLSDDCSHLTRRIIELIYNQLVELIQKSFLIEKNYLIMK